jgi:hypothetical protein
MFLEFGKAHLSMLRPAHNKLEWAVSASPVSLDLGREEAGVTAVAEVAAIYELVSASQHDPGDLAEREF